MSDDVQIEEKMFDEATSIDEKSDNQSAPEIEFTDDFHSLIRSVKSLHDELNEVSGLIDTNDLSDDEFNSSTKRVVGTEQHVKELVSNMLQIVSVSTGNVRQENGFDDYAKRAINQTISTDTCLSGNYDDKTNVLMLSFQLPCRPYDFINSLRSYFLQIWYQLLLDNNIVKIKYNKKNIKIELKFDETINGTKVQLYLLNCKKQTEEQIGQLAEEYINRLKNHKITRKIFLFIKSLYFYHKNHIKFENLDSQIQELLKSTIKMEKDDEILFLQFIQHNEKKVKVTFAVPQFYMKMVKNKDWFKIFEEHESTYALFQRKLRLKFFHMDYVGQDNYGEIMELVHEITSAPIDTIQIFHENKEQYVSLEIRLPKIFFQKSKEKLNTQIQQRIREMKVFQRNSVN